MNLKTIKKLAMFFLSATLLTTVVFYLPARAAEQAPDFTLPSLNGTMVSLNQFKGQKPVLVEFFATWCHFCRAIHPQIVKLRESVPESKLAIVAIDVGSGDSLERVKLYVKNHPSPFTVLYDKGSIVTRTYGVEGIPHIVLVDKNGNIKYQGSELPSDPMSLVQ
ncbi:MAG: TlpA family protein disulfide reductase [Deltaproteobacteria bacterium]|jgi:peroxiredoxin|nr:TlpA family protein disulfide reductase [Deltaproteobacteria bacterium]MDA8305539.1 TlpA disulfide reductase family protein [Deltaproteobacteria bacterium]